MYEERCFTPFRQPVGHIAVPEYFPSPFAGEPHPLCRAAASELQAHLAAQTDWQHDFGIDTFVEGTNIGKMFGVLVVERADGQLGYLSAFSGKLAGTNHLPGFVPPVADLLHPQGFYRLGEERISAINRQIAELESDPLFVQRQEGHRALQQRSEEELARYRADMKAAKQERDRVRSSAESAMTAQDLDALKEQLKNESLKWQYDLKVLSKQWAEALAESSAGLAELAQHIEALKQERKQSSASLQQRMFTQYSFLNACGEVQSLRDIFAGTSQPVPPAGAGDCAGPKLLQYAYRQGMRPVAMAEFWWGQAPASEIRRHGHFYPACRGKCLPILGHMLGGLPQQPQSRAQAPVLNILYQDASIVIIDKQAELLSVPGNIDAPSVYGIARELFPQAEEPMMVHRLDMSTSGILVLALTKQAHRSLQEQFLARTVKKEYIALVEGSVSGEGGCIDLPLRPDIDDRPRQVVCQTYGKPSQSLWTVIGRDGGRTRVRLEPLTGRTHQLRVHAAHPEGLNCPIVGDDLYGQPCGRLHLHAASISFLHPVTRQLMRFDCEAPF